MLLSRCQSVVIVDFFIWGFNGLPFSLAGTFWWSKDSLLARILISLWVSESTFDFHRYSPYTVGSKTTGLEWKWNTVLLICSVWSQPLRCEKYLHIWNVQSYYTCSTNQDFWCVAAFKSGWQQGRKRDWLATVGATSAQNWRILGWG